MSDLISRSALIEEMWKKHKEIEEHYDLFVDEVKEMFCWVVATIDEQPTIEAVEVVHGEWKQCFEDWRKQIEGDECSVCGFQQYGGVKGYNFCPNCGADMRKGGAE